MEGWNEEYAGAGTKSEEERRAAAAAAKKKRCEENVE